jgi:hypothetical protein
MNDTRLSHLLHDLASEMPVDVEPSTRRVVRRARGRRIGMVLATTVAVVAVVVGGVSALRAVAPDGAGTNPPVVPATDAPVVPSDDFAGLWPETSPEGLAQTQAQVDDGHSPLRLDPEQTAVMLATNVLGWAYDDVRATGEDHGGGLVTVTLVNATFPDVPPVGVGVAQLGRTGPDGIWTVVKVSTSLIRIDRTELTNGSMRLSGRLADRRTGWTLEFEILPEPPDPAADASGSVVIDGDVIDLTYPLPTDEQRTFWLLLGDADGRTIGAAAVALPPSPGGASAPSPSAGAGTAVQGVPPDVAATAQRIHDAALAHDVDALRELLDPMTFVYNFGDGSDPTPEWAADPSVLDTLAAILTLPPTVRETEDFGDLYVWPYFVDEDLATLDAAQLEALAAIGVSEEDVRQMVEGDTGYLGPRTTIAADGSWLNYVTGGD